jgi:hypothetical protein
MSTRTISTRAAAIASMAAVIMALALPAHAATSDRPYIDSAPKAVAYLSDATIAGHVTGDTPNDTLTLDRRHAAHSWTPIRTRTVDGGENVTFHLSNLHRTAEYRLTTTDQSGSASHSDPVSIVVDPKLKVHAAPSEVMEGNRVHVAGRLLPARSGRTVLIEAKRDGAWHTIGRTGVFGSYFKIGLGARYGTRKVRATFAGDAANGPASQGAPLTVFHPDVATWYGPGFYNHRTACGKVLHSDTMGVANRNLPCGAKVSFHFRGRTVTVPVIDRGPYGRANWDLTQAAANRLRFSGERKLGVARK